MIRVSVIIPNYNHALYLQQRMDSVLNQSFQDFELIIIDDASTDNSLEILNSYKNHPKITHVILNKTNSGSPFIQWQKGIELAQGEYIWIAESDDVAEINFLETTVDILDKNETVGLVYTDSKIIDSQGKLIGLWKEKRNTYFNTTRWSNDYNNHGLFEILDYLLYKVSINNVSAVLFRKAKLLQLTLKQLEQFINAGDLFVYIVVLMDSEIHYIAEPLNYYRKHKKSTTEQNVKSGIFYLDALKCYRVIFDILKDKKFDATLIKSVEKAYKFFIKRFGFSLVNEGYSKELYRFINTLKTYKILNFFDAFILLVGFKLYALKSSRIKALSKRVIIFKLS